MSSAIEVEDVSRRFGSIQALDRFSLRVAESSVMGIVGPNGAGKTTLLDVICGLIRPDSGKVRLSGREMSPAVRAHIGIVPQETALYEELTPIENLEFSAALYGLARPRRRIDEVLALVGLSSRARDRVGVLSGGMQRRLSIARALLHDPELLILDEPTLGVDVEARHAIWNRIRALRAEGRTVLLATNYLDEAEALCDRVAVLRDGKLLVEETPAALTALAGRCLELECSPSDVQLLRDAMAKAPGVLRTGVSEDRLSVYFDAKIVADDLVRRAMDTASLQGFRVRSPDLVEVFRAVSEAPNP